MRDFICTLFLTSAIFLNSVQLSSQAPPRPPPRPVGEPYPVELEPQNENEFLVRGYANKLIAMPNRGHFRARFDDLVKMYYEDPQGLITVVERDGQAFTVFPGDSELGRLQAQQGNIPHPMGRGLIPGPRGGASGSGSSRRGRS